MNNIRRMSQDNASSKTEKNINRSSQAPLVNCLFLLHCFIALCMKTSHLPYKIALSCCFHVCKYNVFYWKYEKNTLNFNRINLFSLWKMEKEMSEWMNGRKFIAYLPSCCMRHAFITQRCAINTAHYIYILHIYLVFCFDHTKEYLKHMSCEYKIINMNFPAFHSAQSLIKMASS